jgi:hypothetical protein
MPELPESASSNVTAARSISLNDCPWKHFSHRPDCDIKQTVAIITFGFCCGLFFFSCFGSFTGCASCLFLTFFPSL